MTTDALLNEGQTSSTETTETQIRDFLREHNEVEMILPVLIGLFVTSRFQLRGVNALLVNLAVASILRQVFSQLKNPESVSVSTKQVKTTQTASTNQGYSIIHSVPGRIRLRINKLSQDSAFAQRLEHLLNNDEYVISARINSSANCVVINYQASGLSDLDLGLRLMNILSTAESETYSTENHSE